MLALAHVFFESLSYVPYALAVYICLLFAPALAFFPRLIQKPAYFIGVPIISLLINAFFAAVLFKFQWYTHAVVLPITLILTAIAMLRQYFYYSQHKFIHWHKNDGYILMINVVAVIPLFVMSGMSAFMDSDALISWNAWAQYYYFDASHTALFFPTGYPPFFPLLLSYIYKFLGTTLYQGVAKTVMAVFPFVTISCIALAGKVSQKSWLIFIVYMVTIYMTVFEGMGYRFYSLGYSDPLLVACLTLAVFYLVLYIEEKETSQPFMLLVATLATIAASLSKQPGFLWALFSFPLMLIIKMIRTKQLNRYEIGAIFAAVIPVLCWVLGPGRHFTQNTGVIYASTGSNTIHINALLLAMWTSIKKFWIGSLYVFLLYVWAFFSLRKNFTLTVVFLSFIVPGTVLWFMFGSYDLRLGLQLISLCALIIAYQGFPPFDKITPQRIFNFKRIFQGSIMLGVMSFVFFSINENFVEHSLIHGHIYPLNGPKTIIYHYYNQDGGWVYEHIYQHPEKKLWTPNWYIAALFENNNPIITPPETNDIPQVYANILSTRPDYLFAGDFPGSFPSENAFRKIAAACPFLFKEHALTKQESKLDYNYRIFLFHDSKKAVLMCQNRIMHEYH